MSSVHTKEVGTVGTLHGIIPIVYTPFDATGAIDEADVRRLVNYLLAAGAHGLAAVGGASECHKLTVDERNQLAGIVIDETRHRVPVIVGVSAATTEVAVTLSRQAQALGAAAVFATPPTEGPADLAALRRHFGALAGATDLPLILQDAQITVAPGDIAALAAELPALRYVKEEAADSGHRITALRRLVGDRLGILSGGSYLMDDLARGAQGAIPGSVGVADLASAYNHFTGGDVVAARVAFNHFLPLSFWRRQFPLLGAKEVLRRQGVFKVASLREPAGQTLDGQDHQELTALLAAMGPPF
jgi:dihydrodipicolinate synthase/N-acetylneuraminate lyase